MRDNLRASSFPLLLPAPLSAKQELRKIPYDSTLSHDIAISLLLDWLDLSEYLIIFH